MLALDHDADVNSKDRVGVNLHYYSFQFSH